MILGGRDASIANSGANSGANYSTHQLYSAADSSTVQAYVPITITNSQSEATPSQFQVMIHFDPSTYASKEAEDLSNIRLCSDDECTNMLYAWLESCDPSCSPFATSAIAWVNLGLEVVPATESITIYMAFLPTTSNFQTSENYWGEAPQLSSPYGKYDNGANVFPVLYENFAGTSTPAGWSNLGSSIDNGATVSGSDSYLLSSSSYGLNAGQILDVYGISDDVPSFTAGHLGVGYFDPNDANGAIKNSAFWSFQGAASQIVDLETDPTGAHYNGQGSSDGDVGTLNPSYGTYHIFSVYSPSSAEDSFSYDYGATETLTGEPMASSEPVGILQQIGGSNIATMYWIRIRAYPPNGVLPIIALSPLTSSYQTLNLIPNTSGKCASALINSPTNNYDYCAFGDSTISGDLWNIANSCSQSPMSPLTCGTSMILDGVGHLETIVDFATASYPLTTENGVNYQRSVLGYPSITYGRSPNGGVCTSISTLLNLFTPQSSFGATCNGANGMTIANMPDVTSIVDYTFSPDSNPVDFAYDIWATQSLTETAAANTDLEFMIWTGYTQAAYSVLADLSLIPDGIVVNVGTFNFPTIENGVVQNAAWTMFILNGDPQLTNTHTAVYLVLNDPVSSGTVGIDLKSLLIQMESSLVSTFSLLGYGPWPSLSALENYYLSAIDLGSEFGVSTVLGSGSVSYSWSLQNYCYVVNEVLSSSSTDLSCGSSSPSPIQISAESPVNLLVTAPNGEQAGFESDGSAVNGITGATLVGPCSPTSDQTVSITIPDPMPGQYQITSFPSCASSGGTPYTINVEGATGIESQSFTATLGGNPTTLYAVLSSDGSITLLVSPSSPVPQFPFGFLQIIALMMIVLIGIAGSKRAPHLRRFASQT